MLAVFWAMAQLKPAECWVFLHRGVDTSLLEGGLVQQTMQDREPTFSLSWTRVLIIWEMQMTFCLCHCLEFFSLLALNLVLSVCFVAHLKSGSCVSPFMGACQGNTQLWCLKVWGLGQGAIFSTRETLAASLQVCSRSLVGSGGVSWGKHNTWAPEVHVLGLSFKFYKRYLCCCCCFFPPLYRDGEWCRNCLGRALLGLWNLVKWEDGEKPVCPFNFFIGLLECK